MTEKQLAAKIAEAVRRQGPANAVASVLASLDQEDILSLWECVGARVVREVWRTHRPQLELVVSIQGALRQLVSIGTSGEKKTLGEVSAAELFVIAQVRARMGDTLKAQSAALRRIGNYIGERTVGDAWGDIPAADRVALFSAFGITAPKRTALSA